jgi:hypothetical protein
MIASRNDRQLVQRFDAAMHGIYDAARRLKPPYTPSDFRSMLALHGGVTTADILLATREPSSGFTELFLRGRENIVLAVEYLVLQEPWRQLFTPEQRAIARERLLKVEFPPPPDDVADDQAPLKDLPLAEELPEGLELIEGAVRQVTINAYERNPIARAQCIAHFGKRCVICRFDFGEVYGPATDGYIHVHHLTPVSSIGSEYQVDPIRDLRPVCANCHAVIHLGGTTRSLEEMKALISVSRPAV